MRSVTEIPPERLARTDEDSIREKITWELLERLIKPAERTPTLDATNWLKPWLKSNERQHEEFQSTLANVGIIPVTPQERGRRAVLNSIQKTVENAEEHYRLAVEQLGELEQSLSVSSRDESDNALKSLREDYDRLRAEPGMTLPALDTALTEMIAAFEREQQSSADHLSDLQQSARLLVEDLRRYRTRILYAGAPLSYQWTVVVPLLLIGLPLTLLLLLSSQLVLALVWLITVALLPRVGALAYQRRQRSDAYRLYFDTQKEALNLQFEIVQQHVITFYLGRLVQALKSEFQAENITHPAQLTIQIGNLLKQRTQPAAPGIENELPEWHDLMSLVLAKIWTSADEGAIQKAAEEQIRSVRLRTSNARLVTVLRQEINALADETWTLLATHKNLLLEETVKEPGLFLGLSGWEGINSAEVQQMFSELSIKVRDISAQIASTDEHQIFALRVRRNIPLAALMARETLQPSYEKACFYETPDGQTLTIRSFLHPMRSGVASPDILTAQPRQLRDFPPLIMGLTVLLRLGRQRAAAIPEVRAPINDEINRLCDKLGVSGGDALDWDTFCGLLSEHLPGVQDLFEKAEAYHRETKPRMPPAPTCWQPWSATIHRLLRSIMQIGKSGSGNKLRRCCQE